MISTTFLSRSGIFAVMMTGIAIVPGLCQDPKDLPSLNSIRTPNSPAFSILGVQPTSVERPNTPADLTFSIDNATEGFTEFPQNYSLEFSPYWMTRKPMSVTWQNDVKRTLSQSVARTFSISFATTFKEQEEKEDRGLSYGLRASILSGKTSDESVKMITAKEKALKEFSKNFREQSAREADSLRRELIRSLQSATTDNQRENAQIRFNAEMTRINEERLKNISASKEDSVEHFLTVQEFAPQRVGLILEVAFAGAYRNDSTSSDLKDDGYAFWLTPAYVQQNYSVVGVFRYLKDSLSNESMEYGARLVMTKNRYAISVEYLKGNYRGEVNLPDRERLSVLLEFVVNKKLWATISFGEDNKNLGGENSLFSALGLKFNIAKDRFKFE